MEMDESGNGKRGCPVFPASGAIILPNTRSQCSVEMKVPGFSNGLGATSCVSPVRDVMSSCVSSLLELCRLYDLIPPPPPHTTGFRPTIPSDWPHAPTRGPTHPSPRQWRAAPPHPHIPILESSLLPSRANRLLKMPCYAWHIGRVKASRPRIPSLAISTRAVNYRSSCPQPLISGKAPLPAQGSDDGWFARSGLGA